MRWKALILAALLLAFPLTATADDAATVWDRHLAAASAGDLEAVMADFGPDSAILTSDKVLAGTEAIRAFFTEVLDGLTPEVAATVTVNTFSVHGDLVVFNFTVGAEATTYHDVALIRDGRILVLTTVAYPAL